MNHQLTSPTMSPKSFVKDVVKRLELVTPKSDRADATGPSCLEAAKELQFMSIVEVNRREACCLREHINYSQIIEIPLN